MNLLSGGKTYKLQNEKDLRSNRPSNYTATISGFKEVFNILPGTVLFLGFYKGTGSIYVEVSKHEMIRYMNFKTIDVWNGMELVKGTQLGVLDKPLQFEYCTVYQQGSPYPVRFDFRTYYKQNPIDILDGVYWPYREISISNGVIRENNVYKFSEQERKEWFSSEPNLNATYSSEGADYWRER